MASRADEIVESRKAAVWDEGKDRLKATALGISGQQRALHRPCMAVEPDIL